MAAKAPPLSGAPMLIVLALLLLAAPGCQLAHAALSVAPPNSLTTLAQTSPADFKTQAQAIAALGSSQQGIRQLVEQNQYGFAEGLPAELATQEPGLSWLAAAAEAYSLLYNGVDFASRIYAPGPNGTLVIPTNRWFFVNRIVVNGSVTGGNGVTHYAVFYYDFTSTGPIVFNVPPTAKEGYWLISFYDAFYSQYDVVGTRNTGNGSGRWLLVPPSYSGSTAGFLPSQIIRSPTVQGTVLGRIALTTPNVDAFINGWNVTALDGSPTPSPNKKPVTIDTETALQARNVSLNSKLYFWQVASAHYAINPKPELEDPLDLQLSQWLGFSGAFDPNNITDLAKKALTYAPLVASRLIEARYFQIGPKTSNYWSQWVADERWGTDYLLGAAIIKGFWVANYLEDAAYYYQYLDSTGLPLRGNATYKLAFKAAPPHDPRAFWSLQVFDATTLTYPGAGSQGYGAGYLGLKVLTSLNATAHADGSFDIIVGPSQPSGLGAGVNYLPTVVPNQIFLILRVYYGGPEITGNSLVLPAVALQ